MMFNKNMSLLRFMMLSLGLIVFSDVIAMQPNKPSGDRKRPREELIVLDSDDDSDDRAAEEELAAALELSKQPIFQRRTINEPPRQIIVSQALRDEQRNKKQVAQNLINQYRHQMLLHHGGVVQVTVGGALFIVPVPPQGGAEPQLPEYDFLLVLDDPDLAPKVVRLAVPYELVPPIDKDIQDEQCSACLDETRTFSFDTASPDVAVKLVCSHFFHQSCIEQWKGEAYHDESPANFCPVCRARIQETIPQ